MSTILEALKKSEQERKLSKIPTLSSMSAPQEASRWPMIGFIVLAIVVLIVLGFMGVNWFTKGSLLGQGSLSKDRSSAPIAVTNDTVGTTKPAPGSDEIVVNVVSYSEQAEQRFAMINGKLFREGEFVRGGLKVEKIRSNEVVLNLRGRRIVRTP